MDIQHSLVQYIQDNLERGYNLVDIKKRLLDFGHNKDIIETAIEKIDNHPIKSELDNDAFDNFVLEISQYIKEHSRHHDVNSIKRHLLNHGHNEKIIDKAIQIARIGDPDKYNHFKEKLDKFFLPGTLFFILIIILNIAATTMAPVLTVLIALLPITLSVLVFSFFGKDMHKFLYAGLGPIISLIFYIVASNSCSAIFETMDLYRITGFNIIIAWIFSF